MQYPKLSFPVSIQKSFDVQIDFIETLVKMVDFVRESTLVEENKQMAIKGLDMVIKSIKTNPREIVGQMDFVKR